MKCVKVKDKKLMEISQIDEPISEGGSVTFKVDACGICGSDIHYWDSAAIPGLVMGHEFAGTVIDQGNRKDLKPGDRVTGLPISPCMECTPCKTGNPQYCAKTWSEAVGLSLTNPGGYAEYSSCRADMVRKIPEGVTSEEACMVEPSAVALHAIDLADVKVGDTVLIVGGGIIGLMTAEFAKLNGASHIVMLETNPKRGEKSVKYGCVDEYYDAKDEKTVGTLLEKTKGGFDKVFECCGNGPAVTESIMCVRPGGTLVLVGVSLGPVTIPTVAAVMKEVAMLGAIAYTEYEFDTVLRLIDKKKINVKKYIDDIVPLEDAQKSFERLTSGNDDAVKIIFRP